MVGVDVEGIGIALEGLIGGDDELEGLLDAGVNIRDGELAGVHSVDELAGGVEAGRRHLERRTGRDAGDVVVGAAPVGDDGAVEAPLVEEDFLEQMLVLVGVGAVDQVVAGHEVLGVGLLDGDLETGEVDLAQRALIEHGVGCLAAGLLLVAGEVLGAGGEALVLDAAHIACGHLSCEIGILGDVLEVASAERVALDAEAGAQDDVVVHGRRLLGERHADLLGELGLPGVGDGHGRGEAGCGKRAADTQMVGTLALDAQAVGAIGEVELGHALGRIRLRTERGGAGEQRAFLLEGEAGDDVFVGHDNPFSQDTP